MTYRARAWVAALAAAAAAATMPAAAQEAQIACRVVTGPMPLARVQEASGVAAGGRTPGTVWTHNDSGAPVLVAADERGATLGRVPVTGARVDDWEDIAAAPCPAGRCLYIADIGDNAGQRRYITVYRVPEPRPADRASAPAEAFHAVYPEGPQDAESLFVVDGRVFVVTKGERGPIAVYRFPALARGDTPLRLERVGQPLARGPVKPEARVTGAAASPDGRWIVMRTHDELHFYRAAGLLAGRGTVAARASVRALGEPQGEGVALADDGTVFLVSEAGGARRPATLTRLACPLPR